MTQQTQQQQEVKKVYAIYYKDKAGRKYCVHTKPCTRAEAFEGWNDLNSLNTFVKTRIVAY